MHYTPNYLMSSLALQNLQETIPFLNSEEKLHHKKYLVMLRNPNTRAMSSWWTKEKLKKQKRISAQTNFETMLRAGIEHESKLRQCYASRGFNFSEMVSQSLDLEKLKETKVLEKCKVSSLNNVGAEKRAHIGKSLYAHTLVSNFDMN